MVLSSSQIYVTTYHAPSEDKSPLAPAVTQAPRAPEPSVGSRWRFGRSTPNLRQPDSRSSSITGQDPSPSPSVTKPKLERSSSRMSLFNLFSKPKAEKARGYTEIGLAVPMRPKTPPKTPRPSSPSKSSLRQNPPPAAQQSIRSRSSLLFRQSMRPLPPPAASPQLKEFGNWDPPPLFQAFPQSVKHATVQACVFAPEVLMRTQSQKRQTEALLERMDSVRDLSVITEDGGEAKQLEKTHRRLVSNSVLNPPTPELTNKIYILVTAGYVLQYAGEGSFDRVPEKVLKLGKDSAAFACDLIPGKHWVLQISSHAHDVSRVEASPRNSIISRLRSQTPATRKSATSFLLVMESAEEMDSWMTAVRKEIDRQGGMKATDRSRRASTSTEDSGDTKSPETIGHRYKVHRDPKAPSKIPVDSPLQSQYSSPKIITSDWESNRSERTTSTSESLSGQSYRYGGNRQSTESSSVASTPISQDHQNQLDQLRGRPRFSFMSTATTASTPRTRSPSRSSSPNAQSPLMDGTSPLVENEAFRSATSLKSFHMNPGNSMSSRRRSTQPLPVTNEHFIPPVEVKVERQSHLFFGPASPNMADTEHADSMDQMPSPETTVQRQEAQTSIAGTHKLADRQSTTLVHSPVVETNGPPAVGTQPQAREANLIRPKLRTYSIPPRKDNVSPIPRDSAPLPPPSTNRQTLIGTLPMIMTPSAAPSDPPLGMGATRCFSASPRPFLRPFPVRPQQQHADQVNVVPRRLSSLTPNSKPAPLPLRVNVNRSVTAPVRSSSNTASSGPPLTAANLTLSEQALRRPTSIQVRPSQPPFQTMARPVRAVVSTPSFVPTKRTSNPNVVPPNTQSSALSSSAFEERAMRDFQEQMQPKLVAPRRSMGAIGLPPPMPPPDLPLPPPPPSTSTQPMPSSMPLPGPPPSMPLPAPPPQMALPSLPPSAPLPPLPASAPKQIST